MNYFDAIAAQENTFPVRSDRHRFRVDDKTLDIVRPHGGLHQIPNSEFNHGATRTHGRALAQGGPSLISPRARRPRQPLVVALVDAFAIDERVASLYGRHIPRPGCDPITKRDIEEFFKMMGPPDRPTVRTVAPGPEGEAEYQANEGIIGFYSDANSCLRKSVWEKIPYQPLSYAEDQAFGRDILRAGYAKVYEPRAAVYHSHSYPPLKYFRRQFDEYAGMRRAIGYRQEGSIFRVVGGALRAGVIDTGYIRTQPYSRPAKAKWITYAFAVDFLRRFAGYLAAREEKLPKRVVRTISLEAKARKGVKTRPVMLGLHAP